MYKEGIVNNEYTIGNHKLSIYIWLIIHIVIETLYLIWLAFNLVPCHNNVKTISF